MAATSGYWPVMNKHFSVKKKENKETGIKPKVVRNLARLRWTPHNSVLPLPADYEIRVSNELFIWSIKVLPMRDTKT